ncbi:MAG: 50S ribosomal protein L24 [Clostridia bacterium]|nr:50S ribosomal protein L24 [Clostridia bacterium]
MNSNLRTGDTVVVIAGKDKGKQGKIIASDAQKSRVTVAGVNVVSKHRKPRSQNDKGGIKKEEAPIDVSNVQIICPQCGKATRIGHLIDESGKKHRKCKKCNAIMDGEKRTKVVKNTQKESKASAKEKTNEKVVEAKANKAQKAPEKVQDAEVAPKAKVDAAVAERNAPQAKSAK